MSMGFPFSRPSVDRVSIGDVDALDPRGAGAAMKRAIGACCRTSLRPVPGLVTCAVFEHREVGFQHA